MNLYSNVPRLWILLLFSICAFGKITRKDNFFEAEFSNSHKGRMLRVLMTFNNIKVDKCVVECIKHMRCKTVNYNFDKMKCELTDVDFNDAEADKISRGWYNYGTQPKVNGQWGSWREVTQCSAKCEGGTTNQARDCDSPKPQHGGDDCVGNGERTIECNTNLCPVNGNWSAWRNVSTCNVTCGGGTLIQLRQCDLPEPQHGGENCTGERERTIICNTNPCPPVNIALGKQATQSSTYQRYGASNGNDGDDTTSSFTSYTDNPWWMVDLGTDMEIKYIIFRADKYSFSINRYKNVYIYGKSSSASHYTICKILGDLQKPVVTFSCASRQKLRFIKVELKGTSKLLSVKELEVYVNQ